MRQLPRVDALRRIQGKYGTGLGTLILDAGVAAADALQAIRRIEPNEVGEGVPFEHARIDLPLVAAQRETRALAAGIGQNRIELTLPGTHELQLAGGLFVGQALVGTQIRGDQRGADAEQNEHERSGAVQYSADNPAPAQEADRAEQEQKSHQREDGDQCGECHGGSLAGTGTEPHGTNKTLSSVPVSRCRPAYIALFPMICKWCRAMWPR